MNPLQKEPNKRSRAEIDAEIERIAREQGVKPFDPDEFFEDPEITEQELEDFLEMRRQMRKADCDAQEKSWQENGSWQ